MSGVAPIDAAFNAIELPKIGEAQPADKNQIGEAFAKALQSANEAEKSSNTAAEKFAKDDPSIGIHEVMIASEKATIAIRYATTLKNKAVEAYRELMNTQV